MLVYELEENLYDNDEIGAEVELYEEAGEEDIYDGCRIYLEKTKIHIKDLSIYVRVAFYQYALDNVFHTDYDSYMFFDASTDEKIYEEAGSSLAAACYNFCRLRNIDVKLDNLTCEIEV